VYRRGTDEFTRVLAFTDGVFAIAITLLVVGIEIPPLEDSADHGEMLDQLGDATPDMASFLISFAVIGRYWMAHHTFSGLLAAFDRRLIGLNLVYLAFIAFLPFPTSVFGDNFDNGVAVGFYALVVGVVCGMEVVLFRYAHRAGLLRRSPPPDVMRWGMVASTLPAAFFLVSVPVALVSSGLAVALWLAAVPAEVLLRRRRPARAEEYLAG
jgi:uncharacterized membrane protein